VVDGWEELDHVAHQEVGMTPGQLLAAVEGAVGAHAGAIGEAVGTEAPLKKRHGQVADGVMDDAVAEGGSRNEVLLVTAG
jgi:hypothetical protein